MDSDVDSYFEDSDDGYQEDDVASLVRIGERADGSLLRWVSHRIPVERRLTAVLQDQLFDADHELFEASGSQRFYRYFRLRAVSYVVVCGHGGNADD